MALELIVNLLLIAGGIFCFVNVSTTMPHSAVNELGAEQWPQAILVLMLIALAFNVIRFFKINKKEDIEAAFKDFFPAIGRFVKSKLFLGMVLVVIMALMYEPVGFMLTCLLFLFAYGLLLGQRNIPMLILSSGTSASPCFWAFCSLADRFFPCATSPCSLSRSSRIFNRR